MKRAGSLICTLLVMGVAVLGPGLFLSKSFSTPGIAQAAESTAEATKVEAEEEEAKKDDSSTAAIKALAAAIAVGACAFATGFAQSRIGAAAMGTIAEKPEAAPMCIVLLAIPETLVILGFVVGAMILMF